MPACRDRCRCGISRVLGDQAQEVSSMAAGEWRIRSNGSSGNVQQQWRTICPSEGPPGKVGTVEEYRRRSARLPGIRWRQDEDLFGNGADRDERLGTPAERDDERSTPMEHPAGPARRSSSASERGDQMRSGFARGHDVGNSRIQRQPASFRPQFVAVIASTRLSRAARPRTRGRSEQHNR